MAFERHFQKLNARMDAKKKNSNNRAGSQHGPPVPQNGNEKGIQQNAIVEVGNQKGKENERTATAGCARDLLNGTAGIAKYEPVHRESAPPPRGILRGKIYARDYSREIAAARRKPVVVARDGTAAEGNDENRAAEHGPDVQQNSMVAIGNRSGNEDGNGNNKEEVQVNRRVEIASHNLVFRIVATFSVLEFFLAQFFETWLVVAGAVTILISFASFRVLLHGTQQLDRNVKIGPRMLFSWNWFLGSTAAYSFLCVVDHSYRIWMKSFYTSPLLTEVKAAILVVAVVMIPLANSIPQQGRGQAMRAHEQAMPDVADECAAWLLSNIHVSNTTGYNVTGLLNAMQGFREASSEGRVAADVLTRTVDLVDANPVITSQGQGTDRVWLRNGEVE